MFKVLFPSQKIMHEITTKPYMLRAIYEWCTDNGYTPYLAAVVDVYTRVPREFVKNDEIVLNISFSATSGLNIGNDVVHFNARFGGVAHEILVPVKNILAIYARENGQGMSFQVLQQPVLDEKSIEGPSIENPRGVGLCSTSLASVSLTQSEQITTVLHDNGKNEPESSKKMGKPRLTRIK